MNDHYRRREDEEVPAVPATQVVRTGILRGFDPESGIASFSVERNGRMEEMSVSINVRNPLYRSLYETLLAGLDKNGRVPALLIRVAVREGTRPPELLYAEECAPEANKRFAWAGTELRWTQEMDRSVDLDFDWKAAQYASGYLRDFLDGGDSAQILPDIQAEARRIFLEQAAGAGLAGTTAEIADLFHPRGSFREILGASEHRGRVRYDTRYRFEQQNGHVQGDRSATVAALINYAFQAATVELGAQRAATAVYLEEGRVGSLAEAHQLELVKDRLLLHPNPSLETHGKVFAAYSYETARGVIARFMSGAMDAAGISAARPEIDEIELEKRLGDPAQSMHVQTVGALPPEANDPEDPLVRAGAYLATARNLSEGSRLVSQEGVGIAQTHAAPDRKETPEPPRRTNRFAEGVRDGVKALESLCGGM